MDNQILIDRINIFQKNDDRMMRCSSVYVHGKIVPMMVNNEVILKCEKCGWSTRFIPPIFYRDDFNDWYE